jgi:hypothetical protein
MSAHETANGFTIEIQEAQRTLKTLAAERNSALCPMDQSAFDSTARQVIHSLDLPDEEKDKLIIHYQTLVNAEPEYKH